MFSRLLAAGLAGGLALFVLPSPGAEDALTALQRSGARGSGRADVAEAGRNGAMGAPAAAGWGSIDEAAAIPTLPRVPGLPFLQDLINAAPAGSLLCLSGPEGGLSEAEDARARALGWVPVTLGARVLRAETAALAALVLGLS